MKEVKSAIERALERVENNELLVTKEEVEPVELVPVKEEPKKLSPEAERLIDRALVLSEAIAYICHDDGRLSGTFPVSKIAQFLIPYVQKWESVTRSDGSIIIRTDTKILKAILPKRLAEQAEQIIKAHNEPLEADKL